METKNWIAIGAASALSIGVMAAGAVSTANALPLVAGSTNLSVPGISVAESSSDMKGNAFAFSVSSDSIMTPSPTSSNSPQSSVSNSAPSPASPDSPPSPPSPPSPASPASPASVDSPWSVDSVD